MGKLCRPELPPGPLDDLVRELHALHARAGWPSTRELARDQDFSYTSVHDLFTKTVSGPPRLPVLHKVVERLASMAPRTNLEETLDRFDALWRAAGDVPFVEPSDAATLNVEITPVPDAQMVNGPALTKELFFVAESAPPLHDAAAELRRAGFLVRDQPHKIGSTWSLRAYSAASELSDKDLATLNDIAERCEVDFDGWGTYLGPPELDDGPGKPPRPAPKPLFELGEIVTSPEAVNCLHQLGVGRGELLRRHSSGDWGDISRHDSNSNELAVRKKDRQIWSGYGQGEERILVITEADRSVTTVLCPEDL